MRSMQALVACLALMVIVQAAENDKDREGPRPDRADMTEGNER